MTGREVLHQIYAGCWVNIDGFVVPHQTSAGALPPSCIIRLCQMLVAVGTYGWGAPAYQDASPDMCGVVVQCKCSLVSLQPGRQHLQCLPDLATV